MHSFVGIHNFISKRKYVFLAVVIAIIAFASYHASNLKLEEDVSAIIPKDERISSINEVLSQSKFADQIIFMFSLKDSTEENPDALVKVADYFVTNLESDSTHIKSIKFRTELDAFKNVYDFIYKNLPLFLDENDYKTIEEKLNPAVIANEVENNFRTLISPVGMVTKEYILKDPLHLTTIALKKLESFQLDDNFHIYNSCIFTKDNKTLLVFVEPVFTASNTKENKKLIELIDNLSSEFEESNPETTISYYGGTAVAVANASRLKTDIILTVSIAMFLLGVFFFIVFKRIRYIILLFLPIILGILISIALLVIIEGTVSAMALGVGAVLIGISLDYSLHAFTHFKTSGSLVHTLRSIAKPILMSSVSTALAFLCLFIVKSKALNQLGMFAAIAIMATALIVLLIVPFFLNEKKEEGNKNFSFNFLNKIATYRFENNKILIFSIIILSVVFIFTSSRLGFNSDLSKLNYQPDKLEKAEMKLKAISAEAYSAVYFITQGNNINEALKNSEQKLKLLEELRDERIISTITSASNLMFSKELQQEKINRWNEFWDKNRTLELQSNLIEAGEKFRFNISAFKSFFEIINKEFAPIDTEEFDIIYDNFLSNYISEKDGVHSIISIIKVDQKNKNQLFSRFENSDEVIIYDNQYFINRFLEVLKEDFRILVILSMILIFSILLLSYGRIEIAVVSFIPIGLSWLWTIGLMGMFGIEFNIFNIIVTTFVFGLGVDYSIFLMSGLIEQHKYGNASLTPYKMSVLLSAITTVTSFGVLIFAQHPVLRSIAIVSILGITSVILITYTLLPRMFSYLVNSKGKPRLEPITLFNATVSFNALFFFIFGSTLMALLLPVILTLPIRERHKKTFIHYVICKFAWFISVVNHGVRRQYINKEKLDFSKPSVLISNHQSYIDLMYLLQLNPKMIAFTNSWVYNSLFFGRIIRFADFYPVFKGIDQNFEKLKEKINQGYSVLIFPEGTRSADGKIHRFHQGALYVADKLNIDIQPIMIHGIYECIPKTEFYLKSATIRIKFFDRIKVKPIDEAAGETYKEQTKEITQFYREEFTKLKAEVETPKFFKRKLISQYIFKGPVLEWYLRTKIKSEHYYKFYNDVIPRDAKIVDIGCGYGFLSYMLHYISADRIITGIDYDEEKIAVANNIPNKTENLKFINSDITEKELPVADVYILNDVLHYIPQEMQLKVLNQCMDNVGSNGFIILRDADTSLKSRTVFTKFTEIQSTKIYKFNKKKYKLSYFSGKEIEEIAKGKGFICERYDHSKLTSNITYIIKKPGNEQV